MSTAGGLIGHPRKVRRLPAYPPGVSGQAAGGGSGPHGQGHRRRWPRRSATGLPPEGSPAPGVPAGGVRSGHWRWTWPPHKVDPPSSPPAEGRPILCGARRSPPLWRPAVPSFAASDALLRVEDSGSSSLILLPLLSQKSLKLIRASIRDLHKMAMLLGEEGCCRFYCSITGLHDCDRLILIVNDNDAKNIISYCSDEGVVDVYIDTIETDDATTELDASITNEALEGSEHAADIEMMEVDNDSDNNKDDSDENYSNFSDDFEDSEFESDDIQFHDNIDEDIEWVKGWLGDKWVVDLPNSCCSCNKWNLTGIPCVHAIACIFYKREDIESYADYWFKKTTYLKAYEHMLSPIKGQLEWPNSNLIPIVPWFANQKKAGRPKSHARSLEKDEIDTKKYDLKRHGCRYTCSNRGEKGHNKKGCSKSANVAAPTTSTSTLRSKLPVRALQKSSLPPLEIFEHLEDSSKRIARTAMSVLIHVFPLFVRRGRGEEKGDVFIFYK
ncbi:hypothetical protein KSP39_PZI012203 [Platanthera zijinensis]|uniref:SWIM-type domain-containing protein n=1 Tax=Platanthera zijinensis TaxID=2320716 RepID=A0AAP0G4C6_9ASPA